MRNRPKAQRRRREETETKRSTPVGKNKRAAEREMELRRGGLRGEKIRTENWEGREKKSGGHPRVNERIERL